MPIAALSSAPGEDVSREFEELFRDNYALIFRTAYSVTGTRQDAEDVLQTIFLRLLRRGCAEGGGRRITGLPFTFGANASS